MKQSLSGWILFACFAVASSFAAAAPVPDGAAIPVFEAPPDDASPSSCISAFTDYLQAMGRRIDYLLAMKAEPFDFALYLNQLPAEISACAAAFADNHGVLAALEKYIARCSANTSEIEQKATAVTSPEVREAYLQSLQENRKNLAELVLYRHKMDTERSAMESLAEEAAEWILLYRINTEISGPQKSEQILIPIIAQKREEWLERQQAASHIIEEQPGSGLTDELADATITKSEELNGWPPLPPDFRIADSLIKDGCTVPAAIEHVPTGYRFRLIPEGPIKMGATANAWEMCEVEGEESGGEAAMGSYWIGEKEVTCDQYAIFLNSMPGAKSAAYAEFKGAAKIIKKSEREGYASISGYGDHPVVEVSWDNAKGFARWMGADLPSEAEWEKAAKGPSGNNTFSWGEGWNSASANTAERLARVARFADEETWRRWWDDYQKTIKPGFYGTTTAVGSYGAHGFGLFDMSGNVMEWCLDWYAPYSSREAAYAGVTPSRYATTTSMTYYHDGEKRTVNASGRVVRGGAWNLPACAATTSARRKYLPAMKYSNIGFRVCIRRGSESP